MQAKRFVDWSFGHYLNIAPPSFATAGATATSDAETPGDPRAILREMGVRTFTVVAVAVLGAATPASAAAQPRLTLSRAAAAPGARVALAGHGLPARARVRVTLAGVTVRRDRSGPRGGFRLAFRVPAKAAGLYRLRVRVRGESVASRRFRIRRASAPGSPLQPAPQVPAPAGAAAGEHSAAAAPPPDPPTLVAAGDIACSPTQTASETSCHQGETADLVEGLDPDAVAALGDNQYEHGEFDNFTSMYDPTWGSFKPITFPAVGNHEYEGDPERDSAPGTSSTSAPARVMSPRATTGGRSAGGPSSFSTRARSTTPAPATARPCRTTAGPCRVRRAAPRRPGSRPSSTALPDDSCVLAYWHHPRFSSGYGGDNQDYPETGAIYQALYDHGAELVLNGHAHNYERFEPLDPAGAPDADNGITDFVVGTGGRSLFTNPGPQHDTSETLYTDAFGVLELTLDDGGWSSRFVTDSRRDARRRERHLPRRRLRLLTGLSGCG